MKIQLTKEEAEKLLLEAVKEEYEEAFKAGTDMTCSEPFEIVWNGQFIGDDDGLLSFELAIPAQSPDWASPSAHKAKDYRQAVFR